jgi:hypothetical protein
MTAAPSPVTPADPVELRLARSAALFLVALSIPVLALAALLQGTAGLASAAIGAGVVIGMFLMAGATMSWAAKISPAALMGAVLGGFLVRLMIYAGLIILLSPVPWLHGPTLAIATAVLLVAALAFEVRLVSRTPSLFWVNAPVTTAGVTPAAGQPTPAGVVESRNSVGAGAAPDSLVPPVERTRP